MASVTKPDARITAELLAVEDRRCQALLDGDLDTLAELFDDSLVHIHAPGLTQNKSQLLEHVAVRRAYRSITRGELNIRLIGDVAILTGPISNRLRNPGGGERTVDGVATQVLRRDSDAHADWRYVSFQMTPHGEEAWPALPSEQADRGAAPHRQSSPRKEQDPS